MNPSEIISDLILSTIFFFGLNHILTFKYSDMNTRYFISHIILNAYICYATYEVTLGSFMNFMSYECGHTASVRMGTVSVGLHIFHCVSQYRSLRWDDWAHHLISNFLLCYIAHNFGNNTVHIVLFSMCGLPGGIDYFLLYLVKIGVIEPMTEKHINVYLNNWIRVPGLLWSIFISHYMYIKCYDNDLLSYVIAQIVIFINALYYNQKVIGNYAEKAYPKRS